MSLLSLWYRTQQTRLDAAESLYRRLGEEGSWGINGRGANEGFYVYHSPDGSVLHDTLSFNVYTIKDEVKSFIGELVFIAR